MNRFECGWLAGEGIVAAGDIERVARGNLWKAAIVTSMSGRQPGTIANVMIEAGKPLREVSVAARANVPKGTGDLMSAGCCLAACCGVRSLWARPSKEPWPASIVSSSTALALTSCSSPNAFGSSAHEHA